MRIFINTNAHAKESRSIQRNASSVDGQQKSGAEDQGFDKRGFDGSRQR